MLEYEVGGQVVAMTKNEWALSGRDSLYQTFLRAIANFESGFSIPSAPPPPSIFEVNSGGDRVQLTWEYPAEGSPDGFEIYRTQNAYDSTYTLIAELGPEAREYDDTTQIHGIDYYYYLVAVRNNNADQTDEKSTDLPLRSRHYATPAYIPTNLKAAPGDALSS